MARIKQRTTAIAVGANGAAWMDAEPRVAPLHPEHETGSILSAGDPRSSAPSERLREVGIPDGPGGCPSEHGRNRQILLFMNHELGVSAQPRPVIGEPGNRGAIVSTFVLDENGNVISGERAYDLVFLDTSVTRDDIESAMTT